MNDDILIVTKTEYHAVKSCPCDLCVAERARRQASSLAPNASEEQRPRLRQLTPSAATTFGYVKRRSHSGSLARDILLRSQSPETQ